MLEPNEKLRAARQQKHWSQERAAAEIGIDRKTYLRLENGQNYPQPGTLELVCKRFGLSAEELGFPALSQSSKRFVTITSMLESAPVSATQSQKRSNTREKLLTPDGVLTQRLSEEVLVLCGLEAELFLARLGANDMAHFDPQRRSAILTALQAVGSASGIVVVIPHILANPEPWERLTRSATQPQYINQEALQSFEELIEICWHLSNTGQTATVERMLPEFIPQIQAIAQQPSKYQRKAAGIVAQGYILGAEVDRGNVKAMQEYCNLAIQYGELSEDYSLQVAALKQQATIELIADKPERTLEIYLRTLPFLPFVSSLLRSRTYMGMASAYARCGKKNENLASKYLDLAHEAYPPQPESDPSYLYSISSPPTLYLYDGLTYMDLGRYQDAWNSLENVNGLTPKIAVGESIRIEILNLQASAAVGLGELETSLTYVEAAREASAAQGYNLWQSEAHEVFQQIQHTWPHEQQVKGVAERFHLAETSL